MFIESLCQMYYGSRVWCIHVSRYCVEIAVFLACKRLERNGEMENIVLQRVKNSFNTSVGFIRCSLNFHSQKNPSVVPPFNQATTLFCSLKSKGRENGVRFL